MNFTWTAYYALCDPPSFDTIQSDVDLSLPLEPGVVRLPVIEDITMDIYFKGGTLLSFLELLYKTYNEQVDATTIMSYIPVLPIYEQERMHRFLTYLDQGHKLIRLDVLGQSDPQFLGVEKGMVLLGN